MHQRPIKVKNNYPNDEVGRAAQAWNDSVWGAAFTTFFEETRSTVEYFVTFKNEDALNWGRKFLHGRAYEGLKKVGDIFYAIDRKLSFLYHQKGKESIGYALADLWRDHLSMAAVTGRGDAVVKELRIAYSFETMAGKSRWMI